MDKNIKPKVFEPPKVHSRSKRFLFFIEIAAVVVVILGTVGFLIVPKISFPQLVDSIKNALILKKDESLAKGSNFEEKARNQIDKKVLNITVIEKPTSGVILVKSSEGVEVYLVESKELSDQVRTLQTLLSKAKIEKKAVILVDFRFEKLVVRYK